MRVFFACLIFILLILVPISFPSSTYAQYCSDGACTGFLGETCSTCPADCGVCAPTPTPTPIPCEVTTSPSVFNLSVGGTGTVNASVTSGLGSATVLQMLFGSYNTAIATVSPVSDSSSPYSTVVTAVAGGATAVWGTANLSDGRTCQSNAVTDTDVNVSGPTATPTPTPGGGPTSTPTPTPIPLTLSGTVYTDPTGNTCGSTVYTSPVAITVWNGATNEASANSNGSGVYSMIDTYPHSPPNKNAVINPPLGYQLKKIKYQGGLWTNPSSGNTYNFDFSANRTLDWCVSTAADPWFQVGDGDTRSGSLVDTLPPGQVASNNPNSAFFSSNSNANFGSGSVPGFVINNEYSYNDDPKTKQGLFSYTFFMNRSKIKAVSLTTINNTVPGVSNCSDPATACDINNLATGAYWVNGNLKLTSYSQLAGSHVLILVNGTATIKTVSNLKVPSGVGNLFVLAAKTDINIDPSVGALTPIAPCGNSTCTNIEGIYTAEGSINLQGTKCSTGSNPDEQFTLAGTFVANSLKPFKVGGSGMFNPNRSLCPGVAGVSGDATFPVFVIQSRYDFVPQLTDFYKTPAIRWKEVNP